MKNVLKNKLWILWNDQVKIYQNDVREYIISQCYLLYNVWEKLTSGVEI